MPISLRVRLRFANLDAFATGYATNLSRNGVFLEGVPAQPADRIVRFELLLADGTAALRGEGRVLWSRGSGSQSGVAVRFTRLDARSKQHIDEWFQRSVIRSGSIPPPLPKSAPPPRAYDVTEGSSSPPDEEAPAPHAPTQVRASRPSLEQLDADLAALAREVPADPARRANGRPSLAEIDADLECLSQDPAIVARANGASKHGHRVPSANASAARPLARDGTTDASAEHATRRAVTPPPPAAPMSDEALAEGGEEHASPVPAESMREATPLPGDEAAMALANAASIPQAPPMPGNDVAASLEQDHLPDLELSESAEPSIEELDADDIETVDLGDDALEIESDVPGTPAGAGRN